MRGNHRTLGLKLGAGVVACSVLGAAGGAG